MTERPAAANILLLRNQMETLQPSMRAYGDLLELCAAPLLPRGQLASFYPQPAARWLERLPGGGKICRFYSRYLSYPRQVRFLAAGAYHILDHGNAALLQHLPGGRALVTCHDLILLKMAGGAFPGFRPPFLAWATFRRAVASLRRAKRVIAHSRCTAEDLQHGGLLEPRQLEVLPLPVFPEFCPLPPERRQALRQALELEGKEVLLSLGVNQFYKNLNGVLAVAAACRRQRPGTVLLRVGAPLTAAQCRLAARLGLCGAIRELGWIESRQRLNEIYNAADLLLFPSLYEGYGWPVAEAQAAGLPALVSDRGSLPEVAAAPEFCFAPQDTPAMAEAARRLLGDPALRADLAARGLEKSRHLDRHAFGQAMAGLYREVLD